MESRQFYCTFYQRLASQQPAFTHLQQLIRSGTNVQICGYDGRAIGHRSIEEEYLDASRPFGHELVLATMLTCDPVDYPWVKWTQFSF